jgi:hypothetical protein
MGEKTATIPFAMRLCCSVRECCEATSWSPAKIWRLMQAGRLEYRKVDGRRFILVPSLLALLDIKPPSAPTPDAPEQRRHKPVQPSGGSTTQ